MVGRSPHEGQRLTLATLTQCPVVCLYPILYLLLFIAQAVAGVNALSRLTTLRAELYVGVTVQVCGHMIIVA